MVTGTLNVLEALFKLDDRKKAAADEHGFVEPEKVPLVALGFDLDMEELNVAGALTALANAPTSVEEIPNLKRSFSDGVLTGMLLAQLRREAE